MHRNRLSRCRSSFSRWSQALVFRIHGGGCRLVVALEVGLEVVSDMTVP